MRFHKGARQLQERVKRLESAQGEQAHGVQWPGDDLVVDNRTGEQLTPAAWKARYPSGTLIRVVYVDDWRARHPEAN